MKRLMFRLLTGSLIFFVLAAFDGLVLAQGNNGSGGSGPSFSPSPFQYRLEVLYNPSGMSNTSIYCSDFKDVGNSEDIGIVAVGRYTPTDERQRGFIYDLRNPDNKVFIDAEDLFGVVHDANGTPYYVSSFQGITSDGIVVGAARDNVAGGDVKGDNVKAVWFDFFAAEPTLNFLEDQFPVLATVGEHYATDVNNHGDMLVFLYTASQSDGPLAFIANPLPSQEDLIAIDFGIAGETNAPEAINDFRQVVGIIEGVVYRHDANAIANSTKTFPDLHNVNDINNNGEFCGAYEQYVQIRKNQSISYWTAYRYGDQLDWLSEDIGSSLSAWGGRSVNDAGNVAYEMWLNEIPDIGVLYHSGLDQHYLIRDLVEDPLFNAADTGTWGLKLSNTAPTPIIAGHVGYGHDYWEGTTAGGGVFFLIPEPSEPGITVTPTSGLVTTEAGGEATFNVALNTQPSADVTIGISSSNTAEGTVDVASLTFTPADWETAQTVSVTGVNDDDPDNPTFTDDPYTIVIAAATSDDPNYHGLDPEDVSVTNLDNDGPSGGSQIYFSDDTPLSIRDRKNTFSTISIADDYEIVGLNVLLDITHSRPSDLTATLTGPDGTNVSLPTLDGFIDVSAAFSGTSSQGQWILKVRDNERRETGTLNGWSITVDY